MAVVIRLQGLRISAGSEDIRSFFTGLRIPDGGVHIIGGPLGEAFIIFASDEDARRAMSRSGGCIKGTPVNLLLSSKSEMQKLLEESTRKSESSNRGLYKEAVKRPAAEGDAPLLNKDRAGSTFHNSVQYQKEDGAAEDDDVYLNLSGMPFSAKHEDVLLFFDGLQVEDIVLKINRFGMFNGCAVVKFASKDDAAEGLKRDRQYMGQRYIVVTKCTQGHWLNVVSFVRSKGADQVPNRSRSRSPIPYRSRSRSPSQEEYCVLYENLSYSVVKRDIKAFLQPVSVQDDQIVIFVEKNRDRTKSAVVVFQNLQDYCSGLAHHKKTFLHQVVYVSPISKEKMTALLESSKTSREDGRRSGGSQERLQRGSIDLEKRHVYVRNLPFDVRKVEIMDFFYGFQLSEDRVILLHDERGAGLGEALVIFRTEKESMMAQSLNGQRFLGSEVMLKCITGAQMKEFGVSAELLRCTPEKDNWRESATSSEASKFSHGQRFPDNSDGVNAAPQYSHGNGGFEDYGPRQRGFNPPPHGPNEQRFDGPTCLKLLNLPSHINIDELYDFCYGYRVIPGSVSLQYDRDRGTVCSATVVFENYNEAITAILELNGRPIGTRKIKVMFV